MIDQKSHAEIQTYLEIESTIISGKEYRKTVDYIEELINRKVWLIFDQADNSERVSIAQKMLILWPIIVQYE